MRKLFSAAGERALAAVLQRRPLLAFDFDGTLAPIVAQPVDARVPPAIAEQLARLAQLRPVAIVTGRSIADVTPRLGFVPSDIIGNHGAEDLHRDKTGNPRTEVAHRDIGEPGIALDRLRQRLNDAMPALHNAGVAVEDKGYSLALHYRLAQDRNAAQQRIEALLDPLDAGLEVFGGKCVVNVVVGDAPNKGDAVIALVQRHRAGSAVFIGDDVNDEAVFVRAAAHWLTVRIGCDRSVPTDARFCLDSQADVAALLQRMLVLLGNP